MHQHTFHRSCDHTNDLTEMLLKSKTFIELKGVADIPVVWSQQCYLMLQSILCYILIVSTFRPSLLSLPQIKSSMYVMYAYYKLPLISPLSICTYYVCVDCLSLPPPSFTILILPLLCLKTNKLYYFNQNY